LVVEQLLVCAWPWVPSQHHQKQKEKEKGILNQDGACLEFKASVGYIERPCLQKKKKQKKKLVICKELLMEHRI
jgi:hypothetical protein